ncbi:uncharacterized protein si:dkey-58f10.6 isoform X2 [Danio aesculapii]|uniref:uncharacterized protein si:dkey-58f10.6 isoform X2 n=1 Tax=Danio aesculapii TaxID=1142201 RepID=UPI0024C0D509|nr:uncharacterized protein si:dkey-58f10.6 isoform X2 [Danio aesculapii]
MAELRNQFYKIAGKRKCYVLIPGKTFQSQEAYIKNCLENWTGLEMVPVVEQCDVILFFCAIVSRAGTDIDSAVKQLNALSPSKPAVFMVGHHTFDREKTVTDSSKYVTRMNTLTVDCLFNEDVFLDFPRNMETLERIKEWVLQQDTQQSSEECLDKLSVSSELILVLLGTSGFEKNAVANMIFGREDSKEDFAQVTQRKTTIEHGEVRVDVDEEHEMWKVFLVNTPDKFSSGHFEEEISLIAQKPYVLLLIIPEKSFTNKENTNEERETAVRMKEIQKKFHDRFMIISTVTDESKPNQNVPLMNTGEQHNCDHVLNISQREDRYQVSELMKKVEKKLAEGFNKNLTDSQIETAIISKQVLTEEARDYKKVILKNPARTVWFSAEPKEQFVLVSASESKPE